MGPEPANLDHNSNLFRRPGAGLLLVLAHPFLKILGRLLSRPAPVGSPGIVLYQAYQVGDFFMALPATLRLSRHMPVTVICRPDCLFAFAGTPVRAVGFACPFFSRPTPAALWRSLRNAWALRGRVSGPALDFEADPRTAFFLKVAGLGPTLAYPRSHARLFDRLLPLPAVPRHQADKNDALVQALLADLGMSPGPESGSGFSGDGSRPAGASQGPADPAHRPTGAGGSPENAPGGLLLSCWTRKDTKNWPFEHWDVLLAFLLEGTRPVRIVAPPDGDLGFQSFRRRWESRVPFLSGGLESVFAAARASDGIIATDNFLGHMAAFLGRPVLWINGSSDPAHVAPRGPRTKVVQAEPMPCRPCRHRCVNPVRRQCLVELKPEAVIEAARDWPGPG